MDTVKLLILYWGIMLVCYFIASRLREKAAQFGFLNPVMTGIICTLVFIMGLEMGSDQEVTSSLGTIGLQAVLVTAVAVAGSMVFVTLGRKIFRLDRYGLPKDDSSAVHSAESSAAASGVPSGASSGETSASGNENPSGDLKMTLLILGFVFCGMLLGYLLVPRLAPTDAAMEGFQTICGNLLMAGVCLILGVIGFSLGLTGEIAEHLKHVGVKVIVIPLLAVAGSLAGGVLYGCISSLTIAESAAVSAGFGWYTLAPGLITEAGHTVAGAVSFMHNVMREVLGIIGVPMFARVFGYLECTAVPGVCAMDICLPIVEKSTRSDIIVYSFMTGLFMCIAVPVLVPLLIA